MTVTTSPRQGKPAARTVLTLAAAMIAAAVLPVVAGIVFLGSLAARRPLVATVATRLPGPRHRSPGHHHAAFDTRTMNRLTAVWGITLLATGALQALAEVKAGLTITDPAGFAVRTLLAVAVEAALIAGTVIYLHRQPQYSPAANKSVTDAIGNEPLTRRPKGEHYL